MVPSPSPTPVSSPTVPPEASPPSTPTTAIFAPSYSMGHSPKVDQSELRDTIEASLPLRRSPLHFRGQMVDLGGPSLRSQLVAPLPSRGRAMSLLPLADALPKASDRRSPCDPRAPSPLPPVVNQATPTELQQMTERLNQLVAQSNEYVRGLSQRIEALERERNSFSGAATIESLQVFLETRPAIAGLDAERLAALNLPLHVWQHVAEQVLSQHSNSERGLESVMYWRARAEAEALGVITDGRRGSSGAGSSYQISPRSSDAGQSLFLSEGRRASAGTSDVFPPRRPSAYSARSFGSAASLSMGTVDSPARSPEEA